MSDCDRFRPQITAWLDGQLTESKRDALESHIAECHECDRAFADYRRMNGATVNQSINVLSTSMAAETIAEINRRIDAIEPASDLVVELLAMRQEIAALRAEVTELRRELAKRPALPGPRTSPFSFPDLPERPLGQYRLV